MIARGSHFRVRFGWTGWQDKGLTALPSIKDCSASPPSPPSLPSPTFLSHWPTFQLHLFLLPSQFPIESIVQASTISQLKQANPPDQRSNCLKASFQDVQLDNCLCACSITLQRLDHLDLVVQLHFEMLSMLGSASGSLYFLYVPFLQRIVAKSSVCLLINRISQQTWHLSKNLPKISGSKIYTENA